MGKILAHYTKYIKDVPDYKKWNNEQDTKPKEASPASLVLKQKAKAISDPILLFDKYEHERTEDSETFCQTLNMELMSLTGVICSLPIAITKLPNLLKKKAETNDLIKKSCAAINTYSKKTVGKKNIPLPKLLTIASTIIGGIFYVKSMNESVKTQLGITRKGSFDATQNIINDHKMYAILTPSQEKEVKELAKKEIKSNNNIVDKLKDKIDINSSFQAVSEYKKNQKDYQERKNNFNKEIENEQNRNISLSSNTIEEAKKDQQLFEKMLKIVEHDPLVPLEKVEILSNIGYSALFTGGFLEYLISDKLVDMLGIKNKMIRAVAKLGIPLVTYMVLNKNISDFENKVILATKYKHLKQFIENPNEYENKTENKEEKKKESLIDFIKTVSKDIKDYNKFAKDELPFIEAKLNAKRHLKLTSEQEKNAKLLHKNTVMTLNNQREHLFKQTLGIESLSETVLGPIDILGTAIGAKIGHTLGKNSKNHKGLYMGLGAILAFIPVAMVETFFTKQQKLAEKSSVMKAIKDIKNPRKFADIPSLQYENIQKEKNTPKIFQQI